MQLMRKMDVTFDFRESGHYANTASPMPDLYFTLKNRQLSYIHESAQVERLSCFADVVEQSVLALCANYLT